MCKCHTLQTCLKRCQTGFADGDLLKIILVKTVGSNCSAVPSSAHIYLRVQKSKDSRFQGKMFMTFHKAALHIQRGYGEQPL